MGRAVVEAVNNWDDPERLVEIATNVGKGMKGDSNVDMPEEEQLQGRGV
jgi:pyridoxal 5'-phosphate synthase pdxS subunit